MIIDNRHELSLERDLLERDINRICVSNDTNEIFRLHAIAKLRLKAIYDYNKRRIESEAENEF